MLKSQIKYLNADSKRNSKIPEGQTEIVKSEDRQDLGPQNEMKDNHRTHNNTVKTLNAILFSFSYT